MPRTRIVLIAITGVLSLGNSARADNFYFSFTNTVATASGNLVGTVTGEIEGLTNNTTGPAAEVLLISFPIAVVYPPGYVPPEGPGELTGCPPLSATACDVSLWYTQANGLQPNIFTETNGSITYFDFVSESDNANAIFDLQDDGLDYLSYNTGQTRVELDDTGLGSQGVSFTPTPEPSSLILLSTLLLLAASAMRKRFARPAKYPLVRTETR
jgi:hypothetical protein